MASEKKYERISLGCSWQFKYEALVGPPYLQNPDVAASQFLRRLSAFFRQKKGDSRDIPKSLSQNSNLNKKVFLRERKRHTTRSVASACFANGGGVPHPLLDGGYPIKSWMGGGYPIQSWMGGRYPIQSWMGGTPSCLGCGGGHPIQSWTGSYPIQSWMGYPPSAEWATSIQTWDGVPPCPDLGWGTPPSRPGMGYFPNPQVRMQAAKTNVY